MASLKALYDFDAADAEELSFREGDILTGLNLTDDEQWWYGTNAAGDKGRIPANYVEKMKTPKLPAAPPKKGALPTPNAKAKTNAPPSGANEYMNPVVDASISTRSPTSPKDVRVAVVNNPTSPKASPAASPSTPGNARKLLNKTKSMSSNSVKNYIAYTLWAHYLACLAGWSLLCFGPISNKWSESPQRMVKPYGSTYVGLYSVAVGIVVLCIESFNSMIVLPTSFQIVYKIHPIGVFYILASGYAFCSIPTALPAVALLISGVAYNISARREELNDKDVGHTWAFVNKFEAAERAQDKDTAGEVTKTVMKDGIIEWIIYKKNSIIQEGKVGAVVCITLYIAANVVIFAFFYLKFAAIVAAARLKSPTEAPTDAIPFAKGFGGMLNLNCGLIVLPVLKSFMTFLNEQQVAT
jgi:hypothetical protein